MLEFFRRIGESSVRVGLILTSYFLIVNLLSNFDYMYYRQDTFVEEFIGSEDTKVRTVEHMVELEQMTPKKIFYRKGSRPIYIFEKPPISRGAIGEANINEGTCVIRIMPGLDEETYRWVFYHELMHCYGFGHTYNPCDLMNPSVNYCTSDENIKYYADKIGR